MKIKTILGIMFILALVVGSIGIAIASGDDEPNRDGMPDGVVPDELRTHWLCDENGENCEPPGDGDGVCNDP